MCFDDIEIAPGHVIFLNGPSSAGKTSIATELQKKLGEPFVIFGIDKMIGMMPTHVNNWEGEPAELGFWWHEEWDEDGSVLKYIQMGPFAKKIIRTLPGITLSMLQNGLNVIIDEICVSPGCYLHWQKELSDYRVLYVGVKAPVSVLEQREKARGDRIIGSARAQNKEVHKDKAYDLMVDTAEHSTDKCVEFIIDAYLKKRG